MGKTLYLDPFSGLSGDMFLGALLDLGLDLKLLASELDKLNLDGYRLTANKVLRGSLSGTKFDVILEEQCANEDHPHEHTQSHRHDSTQRHLHHRHEHHDHTHHHHDVVHHEYAHEHRSFNEIRQLIESSRLSVCIKERALKAFTALAEAEGKAHRRPMEDVTFHEVGAIDSIIDLVGTCIGLEVLQIDRIVCGTIAIEQGGFVQCAHGQLPLPAFATLELLKGLPVRVTEIRKELTTPTGAALARTLSDSFGPMPEMRIEQIGYGAGTRNDPAIPVPNLLRAVLGTTSAADPRQDRVVEISCNLDDCSGELVGHLIETLLAAGAFDAFAIPIQMKKSRPGVLLTVLAAPETSARCADILFREGTTFGLRYRELSRLKLQRETITVTTPWGTIRVKLGWHEGKRVGVHPEFEDCKKAAQTYRVPLKIVIDKARQLAQGSDESVSDLLA